MDQLHTLSSHYITLHYITCDAIIMYLLFYVVYRIHLVDTLLIGLAFLKVIQKFHVSQQIFLKVAFLLYITLTDFLSIIIFPQTFP